MVLTRQNHLNIKFVQRNKGEFIVESTFSTLMNIMINVAFLQQLFYRYHDQRTSFKMKKKGKLLQFYYKSEFLVVGANLKKKKSAISLT